MKKFDLEYVKEHWEEAQAGKLLQTRDGKPVRLLCLDAKREYSMVGLIYENGTEEIGTWAFHGKYNTSEYKHVRDLFIKTTKHEGWMNIYQREGDDSPHGGPIHNTEKSALHAKNKNTIATIKVEWEE